MNVQLTKENITQKDVIEALSSASKEILPYLQAKREFYNLSEETKNKLNKLVDTYQFIK